MSYALESRVQLSHDLARSTPKLGETGNTPEALKAVAKEFESIFMNMMLKSMRQANRTLSEGNYLNSFESDMYEDMLDEKLSVKLSDNGGLGIADLLIRQFSKDSISPNYDLKMQKPSEPMFASERRAAFDSPDQFVSELLPKAKSAADKLGLDPSYIVAQAALETGWGEKVMFDGNGANSFNLFGIKTDAKWQGSTVAIDSMEVIDGVAALQRSHFKMYDSYADAIDDYQELLNRPHYVDVKNSGDVESFAQALSNGGYATDPRYVQKVTQVHQTVSKIQSEMSQ